jgi:hypothetical protein
LFNISFDIGGRAVKGSGNITTEKRELSGFKAIEVSGVFQVEITAGKDYSVEVQADDNILPLIQTRVSGETLEVELEKKISTHNDLVVRVTVPNIERIGATGASKVTASGIKNDVLSVDTSGASKVTLSGETSRLTIDVSGASNIDAEQLNAVKADVDASGASKVAVNVSSDLHTDASGASRIVYSGEPKMVENRQSGAGSVTKK